MKRTYKMKIDLNNPLTDLNESSIACAPCLKETLKIDRQINKRPLNQIKIEEIKRIVRSIYYNSKDDIKKN